MSKPVTNTSGIRIVCAALALALAGCSGGQATKPASSAHARTAERAQPALAGPSAPLAATDPAVDRPQLQVEVQAAAQPGQRPVLQAAKQPVATDALAQSDLAACQRLCATALRLKCDGDSVMGCENNCRESYALPTCRSEMDAFLACAAERPVGDWECDPEAGASMREGVCDREQSGVMQCMQALAAVGMPE